MIQHYKDYIDIYRWKSICEYIYDNETVGLPIPKEAKLIYVPLEQIKHFFRQYENEQARQFVIVSGNTDFSIVEQKDHPVNADIPKRLNFVDWNKVANMPEYTTINFGPCCDPDNCNINDKYSIKTYALTGATFNKIPDCIHHWWTVNLDTPIPRVSCIPFGLACWEDAERIDRLLQHPPDKGLLAYANWTNYTDDRARLKSIIKNYKLHQAGITLREREISKDLYFEEMAVHYYTISPFGNGLDCYRNWESLYLGCTPIVFESYWANNLLLGDALVMNNLLDLDRMVDEIKEGHVSQSRKINQSLLSFKAWENKIYESVGAII